MRRLPERNFDVLAAVLFGEDFGILRAALIPHEVVTPRAAYVESVNAWRFVLRDDVWALPGVRDVTGTIREAADQLSGGAASRRTE